MKIYFFDMDETLFSHGDRAQATVTRANVSYRLSHSDMAKHVHQDGDDYDFSEFRCSYHFEKSAEPIQEMIDMMLARAETDKVEIMTAREDFNDKDHFGSVLKTHGIDFNKIHVRRAGNVPGDTAAEKKYRHISEQIDKYGYTEVHLYDDNLDNLTAFLTLREPYPHVSLYAVHVLYKDGTVTLTEHGAYHGVETKTKAD